MLRREAEVFDGHRIAAAPGTHAAVIDTLSRYCDTSAAVLDLGCYTGALISRAMKAGFRNISGADIVNRLQDIATPFTKADFNDDFSHLMPRKDYDCIIASEVIEHLDDPRRFIRECREILSENGIIIISTPNIALFEGRIKFLLKGELWGYGAKNYRVQRHISPISREQFPLLFSDCGFNQIDMATAGSFATPLRSVITAPLRWAMRAALGPSTIGETLICVARKLDTRTSALSSDALWGTGRPS